MFSPRENLDLSIDYFNIDMRNQVQDLSTDRLLQLEANCRIGSDVNGNAVDVSSPSCIDAIARINRLANGNLYGITVNPVNVARERTSGIDLSAHYKLATHWQFPFLGQLHLPRNTCSSSTPATLKSTSSRSQWFDIPRNKTSASVSWKERVDGDRHGDRWALPNSIPTTNCRTEAGGKPGSARPALQPSTEYRLTSACVCRCVTNLSTRCHRRIRVTPRILLLCCGRFDGAAATPQFTTHSGRRAVKVEAGAGHVPHRIREPDARGLYLVR